MAKSKINTWVDTEGGTFNLSKVSSIYYRSQMTPRAWEALKRSLLPTQACYDLTANQTAQAILFISSAVIMVI